MLLTLPNLEKKSLHGAEKKEEMMIRDHAGEEEVMKRALCFSLSSVIGLLSVLSSAQVLLRGNVIESIHPMVSHSRQKTTRNKT